jgi:hypothetical protein
MHLNQNNDALPSFITGKDILATQLLEQSVVIVQTIREYAKKNGIILPENETLNRLFMEAKRILDDLNYLETQTNLLPKRTDEKKQLTGTDEEGTAPEQLSPNVIHVSDKSISLHTEQDR